MDRYYSDKLSAQRLRQCYEIAPPRVKQYLQAEIDHVLKHVDPDSSIVELGCGYGRVLKALAEHIDTAVGIDTSLGSLVMARDSLRDYDNCHLVQMDAVNTGLADDAFDVVICIQNGISAFHVDHRELVREAVRITRPGGLAMFSTYTERFWEHRIKWFKLQAEVGLLGEIDHDASGDGVVVCKDGFRATTVSPRELARMTDDLDAEVSLVEVDGSSLFCEIRV
ncbi:MAG: class I SAM-dependent methyltransferase [candidate division Zixibacteria bacterium]|nr:class I SAM-dependent methyltransferase [candidate division Zixibacteria bacterium]